MNDIQERYESTSKNSHYETKETTLKEDENTDRDFETTTGVEITRSFSIGNNNEQIQYSISISI